MSQPSHHTSNRSQLTQYAWLSIGAAVLTIALKIAAYLFTGSVGLLSDAAESLVNLIGALIALAMLTIAARPADDDHAYGHSKAEYFSSGAEGALIVLAAVGIVVAAIPRFMEPRPIEEPGLGLGVSAAASLVNLGAALVILRAGKKNDSVTLTANAHHLLTDVWTSVGVIAAITAVAFTGWNILDPVVACLVAANIVWSGVRIVRTSALGLMDTALPSEELAIVHAQIGKYCSEQVHYHAFRSRRSGARRFVSFHVLVPGAWTVHQGHELLEKIEADIRKALPNITVFTHLESLEDQSSWEDTTLDRH